MAAKLPTAVICEMLGIPKADWDMMFTVANMSIGTHDPEYQVDGDAWRPGGRLSSDCFNYFVNIIASAARTPAPTWSARWSMAKSTARN